jgi:HPt (histidine-containing phosphotransfer) domain-containing protein
MDHDEPMGLHRVLTSVAPPIATDGSEADIDRAAFDNLVAEIGREDTLETFSIFFTEADSRLERLRKLSCDNDRDAIAREAHGLKGSAGNFGLLNVADLAAKLEQDARSITVGQYEAAVLGLETRYATARGRFAEITE